MLAKLMQIAHSPAHFLGCPPASKPEAAPWQKGSWPVTDTGQSMQNVERLRGLAAKTGSSSLQDASLIGTHCCGGSAAKRKAPPGTDYSAETLITSLFLPRGSPTTAGNLQESTLSCGEYVLVTTRKLFVVPCLACWDSELLSPRIYGEVHDAELLGALPPARWGFGCRHRGN